MNRVRSEAGFTLVELLAAVAILGIVIVPLTGAIIVGLRTMDQTSHRYAASNDAQVLTRYLPPDVQSANTGATNSLPACAGTGTIAANRKLQLTINPQGTTGTRTIMYWLRGASGGRLELVRSVWENGALCTSGQAARTTVIARDIASTGDMLVTPLTAPVGFKISVTEAPAQNETSGYTFTVTGRKRTTVS